MATAASKASLLAQVSSGYKSANAAHPEERRVERGAASGSPSAPLGRLAVTRGKLEALRPKCERLIRRAFFTRQLSVLLPAQGPGTTSAAAVPSKEVASFCEKLRHQQACYELRGVPLGAIGEQAFADFAQEHRVSAISRGPGAGLLNGTVFGVRPSGDLVAAIDQATFQQMGVEEPADGNAQLQKLARLLVPGSRRHVRVDLGVSKTRARRARSAPLPAEPPAASRWRSLVDPRDVFDLEVYCDRETEPDGHGPALSRLLEPLRGCHRRDLPSSLRKVSLVQDLAPERPAVVADWLRELCSTTATPQDDGDFGENCEDLMDWIGAVHLKAETQSKSAGSANEALLWRLGEGLMGPQQLAHALETCVGALQSGALPWFLLSWWGDEDAPVSHHGGAHGFDICGCHHVHFLALRPAGGADLGSAQCLMLEQANALHSHVA
eukprot:TRINITY_DN22751_c0_g1_i1.p1 TRINITY_DN22751_c0_g1~~TRINITY_DN22751_c0_g1_i1.p1  ORF type:complete len:439 (-),score=51.89 TRINITY_DN22751_c0_g1_i1:422-1738(-)